MTIQRLWRRIPRVAGCAFLLVAAGAACDHPLPPSPAPAAAPQALASPLHAPPALLDSLQAVSSVLADAWARGEVLLPAGEGDPHAAATASLWLLRSLSPGYVEALERSAQPQLQAAMAQLREIAAQRETMPPKPKARAPQTRPLP